VCLLGGREASSSPLLLNSSFCFNCKNFVVPRFQLLKNKI
jgi:hypothetical protein